MRNLFSYMVTIAIIATIALLPADGYSKPTWRLYDDFESDSIDEDRWNVLAISGSIDIDTEKGMAKFVHYTPPEEPDKVNFLIFDMTPGQLRKIKGIRVTVTVEEYTGYPLVGIGAYISKLEEDLYFYDYLYIQPGSQKISCGLPLFCLPAPPVIVGSLFYGEFGDPGEISGNTFTITIMFSQKSMTYEVSGLGTINRELSQKLDPTDDYFRILATLGIGSAVVYFDDVYILQ